VCQCRYADQIAHRRDDNPMMRSLTVREIGLSMWNGLQGDECAFYEAESRRLDEMADR
jgi:hypothetical protein